jgi:hypothetical protein
VLRLLSDFLPGSADPHPDPLDKGTDPRIRIRTKMSRIHNNAVRNRTHYMKTLSYLEDFPVAGLKLDHRHFDADCKEQI